jgi:uncharacterized protein (DUF736 family)
MEAKNNSGAIFKNDKKTKETHPDYRGKVMVNGKEMEVALWVKESAKGLKYFSAAFSEPYVPTEAPRIQVQQIDEDDLPF